MLAKKHLANVLRKQAVGTNGRKSAAVLHPNVRCLLLPMATQTAIQNDFTPSKAWEGFFDVKADVKVGDQLESDGRTFNVRFIRPFKGVGRASHLHVMCEEEAS